MTRNQDHSPAHHRDRIAASASPSRVAKRIGNFATNLLVSGVILIVGIAFAREVSSWWRGDSAAGEASPIAAVVGDHVTAESGENQLLEFGDFPFVLNRQEFVGDVTQVLEQLRAASRRVVESSQPLTHECGPAEQRMLAAAERLAPVEEQPDRWAIYQIDRPLPMVVGVRSADPQVAAADRRVISWGLAVPAATPAGERQTDWTLFTYSSDSTVETTTARSHWDAPPGGKRTLSLRTDHGGTMVGYAGRGSVESWTKFYDDLFAESPSPTDGGWQVDFGSWRRQFVGTGEETVDVVIRPDDGGTLRSLVITSRREKDSR